MADGEKGVEIGKNKQLLGLGLMAGAGMFFTVGNCLVQYTNMRWPNRMTPFEVLLTRSLIQLFFTVIFMIYGKVHAYGSSLMNLFLLILMGVAEVITIVFIYFALERMPVGDATVIQFTAPVFTIMFSFLLLRKTCSIFDAVCGFVSFVGVVVMTRPTLIFGKHPGTEKAIHPHNHLTKSKSSMSKPGKTEYLAGVAFALVAAIMLALFFVLNKITRIKLDVTLTILYPSILGVVISPVFKAAFKESWFHKWTTEIWILITVVGVLSFVGLMFMGEALQIEDAGPAILIRNLDVVYAFSLQFALLNIPPDYITLLGAAIVIFATSLIVLNRTYFSKLQACQRLQRKESDPDHKPLITMKKDNGNRKTKPR